MDHASISKTAVIHQLLNLGVKPGGVLLVHCAFSKVKPVENGPVGLIDSIRQVLGPDGTLVMPSMTSDDEHPFDPLSTSCIDLGIVADTFWRIPGVLRSDNPHSFSAAGPLAEKIAAPHPVDFPHGLDSPVGRVFEFDGQVLLIGVDHSSDTTIHLCEALAGVRYRRKKHLTLRKDGQPVRIDYSEIDHCCDNFALVDGWLEEQNLQQRGKVGNAAALLIRSRDIVKTVVPRLHQNETAFLHPYGVDIECDEARASIPTG
jgi:aminoglycoside N3'-acetyltransferase